MKQITYRKFRNGNIDIVSRENVETSIGVVVKFNGANPGDVVNFESLGDEAALILTRTLDDDLCVTVPQNMLKGVIRVTLNESNGRTYDCESMLCYVQDNGRVLVTPDDFDYRSKFSEILNAIDETNKRVSELAESIVQMQNTIDTWSKGYDVE